MIPVSPVTRLAPSPTGFLHLGNAWSFLIAWLAARSCHGTVYLRMDDIDPQRSRKEYADAILRDLAWLGMDWDCWQGQDVVWQSGRFEAYENALSQLASAGRVYPCFCSRKEIRTLAGAPHPGDEGAPYSGKCALLPDSVRAKLLSSGRAYSLRFNTPPEPVNFHDLIQGDQTFTKPAWGGDFALRRSDGVWAYQLASAVDDCEMGVNLVIRGRDLLASTPRQIMLTVSLGYEKPHYAHLPLLLDSAGERLAKRHNSLSLKALREQGWSGSDVVGLLAGLARLQPDFAPISPTGLLPAFELELIGPNDIFSQKA